MAVPSSSGESLPSATGTGAALMHRALQVAAATIGLASPNPYVGCVLARDGELLGEGAHRYDQFDHAEIVALHDAAARGRSPQGSTAYVTLEPCSHHGRTGPCADALIAAGVARVVVATEDPNPLVAGRGIARLRAAGVAVEVGLLQSEARALNDAFAHFIRTRRPLVTLKAALSADGMLAPPPSARPPDKPHWLTGPAARADVQLLRHASDAILTGIGTVLADDPSLTDRTALPRRRPLLRVVLDTHLRIPLTSRIVLDAARSGANDVLILCGESAPTAKLVALGAANIAVEHLPGHAERLSLPATLETLAERDILSVLLECGSALNGSFLQQNLVDKAALYLTQARLGPDAVPFVPNALPANVEQRLQGTQRTAFQNGSGEDIRVTGYLRNPWSGAL